MAFSFIAIAFAAPAQSWNQTQAPALNWSAVASSADGSKLVGGGIYEIYTSSNSGLTWVQQTLPSQYGFLEFASSADGSKLAGTSYASVFTSTNYGVSWTSNSLPSANMFAIASSADGTKLAAAVGMTLANSGYAQISGPIYTSTNSGSTWAISGAPTNFWSSVASSADGSRLVACAIGFPSGGSSVYASTDSGTSWNPLDLPTNDWISVATSADGQTIAALDQAMPLDPSNPSDVYLSHDGGNTWTTNPVPFDAEISVATSANGRKIAALGQHSYCQSTDGGMTWTTNNISSSPGWSLAASADGNLVVAVISSADGHSGIWTLQATSSPQLNQFVSSNQIALSWLVPSTNFVLQQSASVNPASWTTVTNTPTLNLTNLQNQVLLNATGQANFYRLRTP